MNAIATELLQKIESKTATVGIVGLGYVGLPLSHACLKAGYKVVGFDIDQRKIDCIKSGKPYIHHLGQEFFDYIKGNAGFLGTANPEDLKKADAILICVPTPLGHHKEPDLSFVLDSTRLIAKVLRKGQLVSLESTTYPGTTRDEMGPILDATGLKRNEDYFLAYSPEREDPGNPNFSASVIPKLVGGTDEASGKLAYALYSRVVSKAHFVSSAEVAETAKLLENIFRSVNIALVNELKGVYSAMGIDIWEVIHAAKSKPFGFMAFYPGPGLGGHCIPIDPFYLTWKAREYGQATRFIELAGEVNTAMPERVVDHVAHALNDRAKSVKGSRILVLGLAYKANVDDDRESPSYHLLEMLQKRGAEVAYHDPYVPVIRPSREHSAWAGRRSVTWDRASIGAFDCVLISTAHACVNYRELAEWAPLIVDTRNAMAGIPTRPGQLFKA